MPAWVPIVYAAVLHVTAVIALTVLIAMGKLSWAEGGPIIGALLGLGVGVPLTVAATSNGPPKPGGAA